MTTVSKLWHYTTGYHWEQIQKAGFLRTSPREPKPGEIAAVWYSSNQIWEPTAAKQIKLRDTGERLGFTSMEFLHNAMGGLVRIAWGGGESGLWTWREFSKRAPGQAAKLAANCERMRRELDWDEPGGPEDWHMIPMVVHRMLWGEVQLWDGRGWK